MTTSPFLEIPRDRWIAENELAFAVLDAFPVSPGHCLVITKRLVPTWFGATLDEQSALMQLVSDVKEHLDEALQPKPDGYNVGFNAGSAAGQTVPHLHVHVIPRYTGDVDDPRGGVRHVIPGKGNYLSDTATASPGRTEASSLQLSAGHPHSPLWQHLSARIAGARTVDVLTSFVQVSGLSLLEEQLFAALRAGAVFRILVGDYLYITDPKALETLLGWTEQVVEPLSQSSKVAGAVTVGVLEDGDVDCINDRVLVPETFHDSFGEFRFSLASRRVAAPGGARCGPICGEHGGRIRSRRC